MVGAVGGGFTISTTSMPKVGVLPRVVSFVMGALLITSAVLVFALERATIPPREDPYPEPVTAPIVAPDGYDINLYADVSLSAPVVTRLPDGYPVTIRCTMQGEAVTSGISGYASSLWDSVAVGGNVVGFVPDVYVGTLTYQPMMPNCDGDF
jgi:hypothetical protein